MTVNAISDTKKGRTGIAPTYLHTTPQFELPGKFAVPSAFPSFRLVLV